MSVNDSKDKLLYCQGSHATFTTFNKSFLSLSPTVPFINIISCDNRVIVAFLSVTRGRCNRTNFGISLPVFLYRLMRPYSILLNLHMRVSAAL